MLVDLGKVLQEKSPKHIGSKAQTRDMSRCQCREAGEDVTWRVFSISLGERDAEPTQRPQKWGEAAKQGKV